MKIPMLDLKSEYLYMKADIDAAIACCLEHQQWILGPEVKEFEDKVAQYLGVRHCIGTSSGTDALILALRALAIKTKGQEYFDRSDLIITTPFTFTATGDAILRAGGTPLFVDIDPTTYNLDPLLIRTCLTSFPHGLSISTIAHSKSRVIGIVPVHLYGQPSHMDEIMSIATEYGLFVAEDCAQAFGAEWQAIDGKRQKVGASGDIGCFSFFPSKNLGGFGDAGMVSTNDDELDDLIRMLLKHGGKDKYNVNHIGYNARLDTLQAAILLAKLPYIDEFNYRRRNIAELYVNGLQGLDGLIFPIAYRPLPTTHCFSHVFHQFTLRASNDSFPIANRPLPLAFMRDALQQHLRASGIDSMVYYPVPLHKMKVFKGMSNIFGQLHEAEQAASEVLSLPVEPLQSNEDTFRVIEAIKKFIE